MKTIKIKIPVAIDAKLNYCGWIINGANSEECAVESMSHVRDDVPRSLVWVEAEIIVPEYPVIQGKVVG